MQMNVKDLPYLCDVNHNCQMRKVRFLLCLITLMLPLSVSADTLDEEIEHERQRMYSFYQTDSVEQFMAAVDQLMKLAERSGDEQNFYRAWSNKALYTFRKLGRENGLALAKEELAYAEKHQSKYGLYSATSANASMMSTLVGCKVFGSIITLFSLGFSFC